MHKIVSTEQIARTMYADAKEKQANLQTLLEQETARLREDIFQRADREIAQAEQDEIARADKAIAALDADLSAKMEESRKFFAANSAQYVEKLYDTVVNADA